jgi:hypothetical protein
MHTPPVSHPLTGRVCPDHNWPVFRRSLRDIHIALSKTSQSDPCTTVTAEMIPHLRPNAWTAADIDKTLNPVRITGQLFFDASHEPCRNGTAKTGDPPRVSNWEIHPVYAIDVCQHPTLGECRVDMDSVWTPLDSNPLAPK